MEHLKKRTLILSMAVLMAFSMTGMAACSGGTKSSDSDSGSGGSGSSDTDVDSSASQEDPVEGGGVYFPIPKMNDEKKLIVIGADLNVGNSERLTLLTLSALQGLANQEEVNVYLDYKLEKDGQYPNDYWLEDMVEHYGITVETKTVGEAIEYYKSFAGENAGFITYSVDYDPVVGTDDSRSLTAAIDLCAIRGWLPVEKSLKETAEQEWGLTEKADASEMTDKDVFEEYKDEFDNSILIQQRPMENKDYSLPMVGLRDYAIANKFFTFYDDGQGQTSANYRHAVHSWAKPNKPILGWGPGDEGDHISYASEAGQFSIPSDFSFNLSVTSADVFQEDPIEQKNQFEEIVPEAGKHYVAIGRSDGDNITTWQTEFVQSLTDYGSTSRTNEDFAMAWSISPILSEIFPALMRNVYRNASDYDYFIAPVSGQGYLYPSRYPEQYRADYFKKLDTFLGKADLHSVCILDYGQEVILKKEVANNYASAENLLGGFVFNGNKYKGGNGAVVWSDNGKPFVAPKESLWQEEPGEVVARIGTYRRDYTRIEGYTYLNLHPWSHTYQDVEYVVQELRKNPNIVIVSPDQLLDMIAKYVPHEDVTSPDNVDPDLPYQVPFDPLDNKFLEGAGTEDWKGISGSVRRVTQSVGGALGSVNGLQINGVAEKTYVMPNEENLQIGFDYVRQSEDAYIKVELEIGGVTKVVFDRLSVRKADGVSNIVIPVTNYFSKKEYADQQAKLRVEVLDDTDNGVIVTNVVTKPAAIADPTSGGDKLHDVNFTTMEDWIAETFAKNASVKVDNGRLMLDGSDGWTGFFDDNININLYKTFTIPEDMQSAEISVRMASSNTGTAINVILVVDGKVYELSDGFTDISKSEERLFNAVVDGKGGANGMIFVMQRDSGKNSGIGEAAYVCEFKVAAPVIDPYYNTFAGSLEDWAAGAQNAVWENAMAKIAAGGSMSKTITMPVIDSGWSQVITFSYKAGNAAEPVTVTLKAEYGGQVYTLKTVENATSSEMLAFEWVEADSSVPVMSGQSVKFTLEAGGGVAYIDDFKVTSKNNTDPYNNTFTSGLEDWVLESKSGWDGNGIALDNQRMMVNLNNYGQVNDAFEIVASKSYRLPDSRNITISFDASAPGGYNGMPQGGSLVMTIEIDGTEYTVLAKQIVNTDNAYPSALKISVALNEVEALSGVDYAGKDVKIRLKFNDEGFANGVAPIIYIDNFVTKAE